MSNEIDAYLADYQGDVHATLMALRKLIRAEVPQASEELKWGRPCYLVNDTLVCSLTGGRYVNLGFAHGASLPDPQGLLEGSGKSLRHVKLHRAADVKSHKAELATLIREAVKIAGRDNAPNSKKAAKKNAKKKTPAAAVPTNIQAALDGRGLVAAFEQRPLYQRRDYLEWITSAKREATQQKRLTQMLDELERGDVYMNQPWRRAT